MTAEPAIAALSGVSMTYGAIKALWDVSLEFRRGEATCVLGPNGAGKSTMLGLLTGLKRPHSGTVRVFGQDPRNAATRKRMGVTPQEAAFPPALKTGEILAFARAHYPDPTDLDELVGDFDLNALMRRNATTLSGGQQRKLAVALAFCGAPDAAFLDEPTTGIDMQSRQRMWDHIQRYKAGGGTLFLTTHYLEEAEQIADRIVLINDGRIIRSGSVREIRDAVNVREIRFSADTAPDLRRARLTGSESGVHTYVSTDADDSVRDLIQSGHAFSRLEVQRVSLEQAVSQAFDGGTA